LLFGWYLRDHHRASAILSTMEAELETLTMRVAELEGENEALTQALLEAMSKTPTTSDDADDARDSDLGDEKTTRSCSMGQLRVMNEHLEARVRELESELGQRKSPVALTATIEGQMPGPDGQNVRPRFGM
jgi:BMFP domain-containing protein YqiC